MFVIEIKVIKLKKYNKVFILITVLLIVGAIPIMNLGNSLGPTLGIKIKYNEFLWEHSFNDNIRYYMAEDIKKIIIEKNYSREDVINMLGKPDFGSDYNNDTYTYFLKNHNIYVGLDISILEIEFYDNKCKDAYIIRMD